MDSLIFCIKVIPKSVISYGIIIILHCTGKVQKKHSSRSQSNEILIRIAAYKYKTDALGAYIFLRYAQVGTPRFKGVHDTPPPCFSKMALHYLTFIFWGDECGFFSVTVFFLVSML